MNRDELCREITDFVSGETTCFDGPNGMVGCNLPITYPDGDHVTVYVAQRDDVWEVSDRGEAYRIVLGRRTVEIKDFTRRAQPICHSLGVVFADGRVLSAARDASLVTQIWAVGSAAARISEYSSFLKPQRIVGRSATITEHQHSQAREHARIRAAELEAAQARERITVEQAATPATPVNAVPAAPAPDTTNEEVPF